MTARHKPSSPASPAGKATALAEVFPDSGILHALSAKLSWTHFRRIIYLDDPLKRDFYAEMCRIGKWNTRTLHQKIQSMLTSGLIPPLERPFKF